MQRRSNRFPYDPSAGIVAARILHRGVPTLAAANDLPPPQELELTVESSIHWWRPPRRLGGFIREMLVDPVEGMKGALRKGRPYWRDKRMWWPTDAPGRTWRRPVLPVSRRSYGWAIGHPGLLALAYIDPLWRALVVHHLWVLSGRPAGPVNPAGPFWSDPPD